MCWGLVLICGSVMCWGAHEVSTRCKHQHASINTSNSSPTYQSMCFAFNSTNLLVDFVPILSGCVDSNLFDGCVYKNPIPFGAQTSSASGQVRFMSCLNLPWRNVFRSLPKTNEEKWWKMVWCVVRMCGVGESHTTTRNMSADQTSKYVQTDLQDVAKVRFSLKNGFISPNLLLNLLKTGLSLQTCS
jgi:hypothetical protein